MVVGAKQNHHFLKEKGLFYFRQNILGIAILPFFILRTLLSLFNLSTNWDAKFKLRKDYSLFSKVTVLLVSLCSITVPGERPKVLLGRKMSSKMQNMLRKFSKSLKMSMIHSLVTNCLCYMKFGQRVKSHRLKFANCHRDPVADSLFSDFEYGILCKYLILFFWWRPEI